jgi:deoxyhypusine monooxygenase
MSAACASLILPATGRQLALLNALSAVSFYLYPGHDTNYLVLHFINTIAGLKDPSALFRHEVAYCLGQRQDAAAIQTLTTILHDTTEHPMVRHEAGEALGAIGKESCLKPLREHVDDECLEVAQTCQLALQRIEYHLSEAEKQHKATYTTGSSGQLLQEKPITEEQNEEQHAGPSPYLSVDPTPPAPDSTPSTELRSCLLNDEGRIFDRYRALFALRNRGGTAEVNALSASFTSNSALLKHEVAYVLGQIQDANTVVQLKSVLEDSTENPMVRHEAAEALGSIAAPECLELLKKYSLDSDPIVADSCVVALDMLEHEQSGEFEYAEV